MKATLAKVIPAPMRPLARDVYRRLAGKPPIWSAEQYRALPALKCEIGYNRYGGYCVPESSRHRPACEAILAHEVWEPETIELIRRECRHGDVVHAGTFFGDFLPGLSTALVPGATIWAFEPSMENYRCSKITAEINALRNVALTHAGLGAQRKAARVKTTDALGALGGHSQILEEGDEDVEIVRIDDAVDGRHVSVIQLDVEGCEREALEGARETLRRCRPILVLEALFDEDLLSGEWFGANLGVLGYRVSSKVHDNVILRA